MKKAKRLGTFVLRYLKNSVGWIILLVFLVLEIGIFNQPYWVTRNSAPETAQIVEIGKGLRCNPDKTVTVTNSEKAYIRIKSKHVMNYLRMEPTAGENAQTVVKWRTEVLREDGATWYGAARTFSYSPTADRSRYWHVENNAKQMKITYFANRGDILPLGKITVNPHIAFKIPVLRLVCEIFIAVLILALRSGSRLYKIPIADSHTKRTKVLWTGIAAAVLVELVLVLAWWIMSNGYKRSMEPAVFYKGCYTLPNQFAETANALLHGHTYLDIPVNKNLPNMSNPYDFEMRCSTQTVNTSDPTPIFFDVAFFKGHYYQYFGVLPVILFFCSFRLLTGHDLNVGPVILILSIMVIAAIAFLSIQFARMLEKQKGRAVSVGSIILANIIFALGIPLFSLIEIGMFYTIPQLSAIFFAIMGIGCWIRSKNQDFNKVWFALGSASMALIIGCRPQLLLAALLVFPIFWEEIIQLWKDGLVSAQGLRKEIFTWLIGVAPAALIFIPFGIYNKMRFGSFFDFGANYNLTAFDMTKHVQPWTEYIHEAFEYFFQPPNLSLEFPFVQPTSQTFNVFIPHLLSFGGWFTFLMPAAAILFFMPQYWKLLRKNKSAAVSVVALVLTAMIFIFDAGKAGYDVRYTADFAWLMLLAIMLIIFSADYVENSYTADGQPVGTVFVRNIGLWGIILGIAACTLVLMYGNMDRLGLWWSVESWFIML